MNLKEYKIKKKKQLIEKTMLDINFNKTKNNDVSTVK